MDVHAIILCDQHVGVHSYLSYIHCLKFVWKRECCFHCYKLCGMTQDWDECVTLSVTARICVRVEFV
jgi:hypothetical protein